MFLLIVDLFMGELLVFLGRRGKVDDSESEKRSQSTYMCQKEKLAV